MVSVFGSSQTLVLERAAFEEWAAGTRKGGCHRPSESHGSGENGVYRAESVSGVKDCFNRGEDRTIHVLCLPGGRLPSVLY